MVHRTLHGLGLLILSLGLLAGSLSAFADGRYDKQKVVYHINGDGGPDGKQYIGAMRNIQNHINAVGADNMEIRVVMHGNGVGLLKLALNNEKLQGQVLDLKSQNVAMQICNNTLIGRKIDYNTDLFDVYEEDIVPSGVAELSHLQQQGFTYVKP